MHAQICGDHYFVPYQKLCNDCQSILKANHSSVAYVQAEIIERKLVDSSHLGFVGYNAPIKSFVHYWP